MSTFLQLAQRLRQEAISAGASALPTTVSSQIGQLKVFVDNIASAWNHIQGLHQNWRWMRRECTYSATSSTRSIVYTSFTDVLASAAISSFARWITERGAWTAYLSSTGQSGEYEMINIPFDTWRYLHDRGSAASQTGKPLYYAVAPNNYLKLGPGTDSTYVLRGWYQQSPTTMTSDSDTPSMPSQHHEIIMWYALSMYGAGDAAPEKVAKGQAMYSTMLAALENDQLPQYSVCDPLA
jgi:hypothetical protein